VRNGNLWIRPRQYEALLLAAGVERIFSEKVSGVATRRPELERALDQLEAGDVLVVTKLDRLARSTLDLLRIIDLIGKEGEPLREIALSYNVDHSTISRLKTRYAAEA